MCLYTLPFPNKALSNEIGPKERGKGERKKIKRDHQLSALHFIDLLGVLASQ